MTKSVWTVADLKKLETARFRREVVSDAALKSVTGPG